MDSYRGNGDCFLVLNRTRAKQSCYDGWYAVSDVDSRESEETPISSPRMLMERVRARFNPKIFFVIALFYNFIVYWLLGVQLWFRIAPFYANINDFYLLFMPAVGRFLANPSNMYLPIATSVLPFRDFPLELLYYTLFGIIPGSMLFKLSVCSFVDFMWTLACLYMIKRIADLPRIKSIRTKGALKNPYTLMGIYLLSAMNWIRYWNAKSNVIVNFLMLMGVYFYLNYQQPAAS